jgi:hypothetical protein
MFVCLRMATWTVFKKCMSAAAFCCQPLVTSTLTMVVNLVVIWCSDVVVFEGDEWRHHACGHAGDVP